MWFDELIFAAVLVLTVVALTTYSVWAAKAPLAGKHRTRLFRRTWALAALFSLMFILGGWDLIASGNRMGFLNWTLFWCGGLSVVFGALNNYKLAEMRSAIVNEI